MCVETIPDRTLLYCDSCVFPKHRWTWGSSGSCAAERLLLGRSRSFRRCCPRPVKNSVSAPRCQGTSAYRWFLLFPLHWERMGRGILSLNISTINNVNVPRANLGAWQIHSSLGKCTPCPLCPNYFKIKTDIKVNF